MQVGTDKKLKLAYIKMTQLQLGKHTLKLKKLGYL